MNQFAELREKCAKIAGNYVGTEQIVDEIRAVPLPTCERCESNSLASIVAEFIAIMDQSENWPDSTSNMTALVQLADKARIATSKKEELKKESDISPLMAMYQFALYCDRKAQLTQTNAMQTPKTNET